MKSVTPGGVRIGLALGVAACLTAASGLGAAGSNPYDKDKEDEKKQAEAVPRPRGPATLKVGSPAPALSIDRWVKGDAVPKFEKGKVYVVEFWATWCGPCIQSIPHLSQLQAQYQDKVTIIGVAASERKAAGSDQRLIKLEQFVRTRGDQMGYWVAYDADGETAQTWMSASGQQGIPCAFVVGHDGKVAYIGSPMGMDAALSKAVASADEAAKKAAPTKKAVPAKPDAKKPATAKPADKPAPKGG
ncbi:MAG: TlpA family protein disulfide reductase [Phycisphaerales bacterium]